MRFLGSSRPSPARLASLNPEMSLLRSVVDKIPCLFEVVSREKRWIIGKMEFSRFSPSPRGVARLEERFKRIITANRAEHFEGKRVLDLAANNGRWTCAAAEAGASEVVAVEGRADKVVEAQELATQLGVAERCKFIVGDIYDWLYENRAARFDTILCLGIFYHIIDHYQLVRLMARLQPKCIIIDSGFVRSFALLVHVKTENPSSHKNALPAFEGQKSEVVGLVTLGLMNQMAWNCGYIVDPVIWDPAEVSNKHSVKDYLSARRFTLRLLKRNHVLGSDDDWQERWRSALVRLAPKFEKLLDPKIAASVEDPRVSDRTAGEDEESGLKSVVRKLSRSLAIGGSK